MPGWKPPTGGIDGKLKELAKGEGVIPMAASLALELKDGRDKLEVLLLIEVLLQLQGISDALKKGR